LWEGINPKNAKLTNFGALQVKASQIKTVILNYASPEIKKIQMELAQGLFLLVMSYIYLYILYIIVYI
jgi:hypothetical protein